MDEKETSIAIKKPNTTEQPEKQITVKIKRHESGATSVESVIITDKQAAFSSLQDQYLVAAKALGFPDIDNAINTLSLMAKAFPGNFEDNFNRMLALIIAQKPKDSVEAILLGQFFLLNELGSLGWRKSYDSEMMCHAEYFAKNAFKFFSLSQQTVHALAKHRTQGVQQVNVVHMEGDSKAVFTGGGAKG
ncbi:MAG: hypothetical protein WCP39_05920 [Chlamydiota bacterium]